MKREEFNRKAVAKLRDDLDDHLADQGLIPLTFHTGKNSPDDYFDFLRQTRADDYRRAKVLDNFLRKHNQPLRDAEVKRRHALRARQ